MTDEARERIVTYLQSIAQMAVRAQNGLRADKPDYEEVSDNIYDIGSDLDHIRRVWRESDAYENRDTDKTY